MLFAIGIDASYVIYPPRRGTEFTLGSVRYELDNPSYLVL